MIDISFQNHSGHYYLVQNIVNSVWMKYQIQLAHILKTLVKRLNKYLYQVQDAEIRLLLIDSKNEI